MTPEIEIIDPYTIPKDDTPILVFSDHTSGLIEWAIKFRTKAEYNHAMFLYEPGKFASQGNTYSLVDCSRYMKKGNRLLFVAIKDMTEIQRRLLRLSIEKKLSLPWYKKLYDWVGIFGQAIGIKKVNIKGLNYCSEDVVVHMKKLGYDLPLHEHPQGLLDWLLKDPIFYKYGIWNYTLRTEE